MQQSKFDNSLNTRNVHLNSSEIFVVTSLEDRPSSTTFRSTPRSAALSDDDGRQEKWFTNQTEQKPVLVFLELPV